MKKQYKAVILVLASENELYNKFKDLYTTYCNSNPEIITFFVYAGKINFTPQYYDLVYPNLKENLLQPNPTKKVLEALRYINNNYTYDYLVRTNLSTFWNLPKLLNRLENLPINNLLTGRIGYIPPQFVVGTDMIVSRDLIGALLANYRAAIFEYKGKYIAEDRILSSFFTDYCGASILDGVRHVKAIENLTEWNEQTFYETVKNVPDCVDHYRIKNTSDRSIDLKVMEFLINYYYG